MHENIIRKLDNIQPGTTFHVNHLTDDGIEAAVMTCILRLLIRFRFAPFGRYYKLTDSEYRLALMARFAEKWILLWSDPDLLTG
jgi:hypothetical protein